MQRLYPSIYGYHCNEDKKIIEFKNRNVDLLESIEDDIWLGNGMYFWDNESNSEYWKRNRVRKFPNKTFSIVKVLLSLENLLDLTDSEHIKLCQKVVGDLKKKGVTELDKTQLGKSINVIFSETDLLDNFNILKIIGLYENWTENPFLQSSVKYQSNRPTSNAKIIYCVKNSDPIKVIYN